MLDLVNDLPSIMVLILSVGMFLFAVLMPIFVMLIYFELKKNQYFSSQIQLQYSRHRDCQLSTATLRK